MRIKKYFFLILSIFLVVNGLFGMDQQEIVEDDKKLLCDLPPDTIIVIFGFLDSKSLMLTQITVCKYFQNIIDNAILKGNCFKITVHIKKSKGEELKKISDRFNENPPLVLVFKGSPSDSLENCGKHFSGKNVVGVVFPNHERIFLGYIIAFFYIFKNIQEISFNSLAFNGLVSNPACKLIKYLCEGKQFNKLKKLEFANGNKYPSDKLVGQLVKSEHLSNLEYLTIKNCRNVTVKSIILIANSENFEDLKTLNCDFDNEMIKVISNPECLKKLRVNELKFFGLGTFSNIIKDDGLECIGRSPKFKGLREIEIGCCSDVTSKGISDLMWTQCFRNLRVLVVSGCSIDDKAILWIATSPNAKTINHLDISNNKNLTDKSLVFICDDRSNLKNLEKLFLNENKNMSREGVLLLFKSNNLKKLKVLKTDYEDLDLGMKKKR